MSSMTSVGVLHPLQRKFTLTQFFPWILLLRKLQAPVPERPAAILQQGFAPVVSICIANMSGSARLQMFVMQSLRNGNPEGLACKPQHHRFDGAAGSSMPNPHDKSLLSVTRKRGTYLLLLPLHDRFLYHSKCASQVATFQTQTYLQCIFEIWWPQTKWSGAR